jgi:uroporphyrinogen-III synthase
MAERSDDTPADTLTGALSDTMIVVTRPAHQAKSLCDLITSLGGNPIRFPVLEITDPNNAQSLSDIKRKLSAANTIIFISPNAVERGLKLIQQAGGISEAVKIAAVGEGSANKLAEQGQPADIFPVSRFNSEALLAMDELQSVSDHRILIFRGEGGREQLAETLRNRGATVEYVECYRRIKPDTDTQELSALLADGSVDAVVVTSNEGLQNLHDMLDPNDRQLLHETQLIVVSDRGQRLALKLGFSRPAIIVDKVSDQGIVDSLLLWKSGRSS